MWPTPGMYAVTSTPLRQAHAGDLAEGGVRLLRGGGVDAGADTASLGRTLQGRRLVLRHLVLAALADQLVNGGHLGGSLSCLLSGPGALPGTGVLRCCLCLCDASRLARAGRRRSTRKGLVVTRHRGSRLLGRPNRVKTSQARRHEIARRLARASHGAGRRWRRCEDQHGERHARRCTSTPPMISVQRAPNVLPDPADDGRAERRAAHDDRHVERHHPAPQRRVGVRAAWSRWRS